MNRTKDILTFATFGVRFLAVGFGLGRDPTLNFVGTMMSTSFPFWRFEAASLSGSPRSSSPRLDPTKALPLMEYVSIGDCSFGLGFGLDVVEVDTQGDSEEA